MGNQDRIGGYHEVEYWAGGFGCSRILGLAVGVLDSDEHVDSNTKVVWERGPEYGVTSYGCSIYHCSFGWRHRDVRERLPHGLNILHLCIASLFTRRSDD
jgi:hypothetical protein